MTATAPRLAGATIRSVMSAVRGPTRSPSQPPSTAPDAPPTPSATTIVPVDSVETPFAPTKKTRGGTTMPPIRLAMVPVTTIQNGRGRSPKRTASAARHRPPASAGEAASAGGPRAPW